MGENIKTRVSNIWGATKTKSQELMGNKNTKIAVITGGIIIFALIVTAIIYSTSSGDKQLYTGLDPAETSEIYSALKLMGADASMSGDGQIMVPEEEHDIWLMALAEQGYPKTGAPAYDILENNAGLTTTEAQFEAWEINSLQDRLQATLTRMTNVQDAVVTLNIADTTDYVWEQAQGDAQSTASVLLTLNSDQTLNSEQVSGIKNLIAASVYNLLPENISVIDAKTSLEFKTNEEDIDTNAITVEQNLEFEAIAQARLEENVVKLLSPRYGADGVVASAKLTINYDEMITESLELQEDENSEGYPTNIYIEAELTEGQEIGGIVGEEDNTDIPTYPTGPLDDQGATYFNSDVDIDYGYIKTQVERGQAIIERATISVMVNEEDMTQTTREELIQLVSNSTDIPQDLIFVSSIHSTPLDNTPPEEDLTSVERLFRDIPYLDLILIGVGILLVIIIVTIFMIRRAIKRKAIRLEEARLAAEAEEKRLAQEEIDNYKKQLADAAKSGEDAKGEAIVEEVRLFARENPAITAGLIRSWLKEGD